MKKILFISESRSTGNCAQAQLREIFKEQVEVDAVLSAEMETIKQTACDLTIFSEEFIRNQVIRNIGDRSNLLTARRIVNHKNIKELISIPEGKEVLLVNDSYKTAMEAIDQLMAIGLGHIKYIPYYPGCMKYPEVDTVITAGEAHLIPYRAAVVIDIGSRILDISSLHEIEKILDIRPSQSQNLILNYIEDIVEISKEIEQNRKESLFENRLLQLMADQGGEGILVVDPLGKIRNLNRKVLEMLRVSQDEVLTKELSDFLPTIRRDAKKEQTLTLRGKKYDVVSIKIPDHRENWEIFRFKKSNTKKGNVGFQPQYQLSDYQTKNPRMLEMLDTARVFAPTDLNVLIEGENGTGKEIIAQGIHNASRRAHQPFVAINISAIPNALLESELFGYEEGSFTNAKRGGRIGLMEEADGGTLFIDEIGEADERIQVKLLRAIEEKKIRRLGSNREIAVDLRIIAATNKNLSSMILADTFRMDLYFRLGGCKIKTVPLRQRPEDIECLLRYFLAGEKRGLSLEDCLSSDTLRYLTEYHWYGNVRELMNVVQFIARLYTGERMTIDRIRPQLMQEAVIGEKTLDQWIMIKLYEAGGVALGRKRLADLALQEGKVYSESQIRHELASMTEKGWIQMDTRGSRLTKSGLKMLCSVVE